MSASEGGPLPDLAERRRIRNDFDANLLVEAGAGSGKTTELTARMVGLIRSGTAEPGRLAAVTFTRKAAGELRERFQEGLEIAVEDDGSGPRERERLRSALQAVDRTFIGTIHAFCARLLREHPLEAGLDPGFRELQEEEAQRLAGHFWRSHLERLAVEEDPTLDRLAATGLEPSHVEAAFRELSEHPDVAWLAPESDRPSVAEIAPVRSTLEELLDRAAGLRPREEDPRGPDSLQKKLPYLLFCRRVLDWSSEEVFFDALARLCGSSKSGVILNRWPDPDGARGLRDDVDAFVASEGPARRLLARWWAYRYHVVLGLARGAAEAYARYRRRMGALTFQDLLLHAARLLRESPDARATLGRRYRFVLVDEFQDTDPLQAEVLFLLSSAPEDDPGEGPRWQRVRPRPGALFVVGDPKQSIYRFRRADIAVYDAVKARFRAFGDVLTLTSNFRSRASVAELVNDVFRGSPGFPEEGSSYQAPFAPLLPQEPGEPPPKEGVYWYRVAIDRSARDAVAEEDAALLASWIKRRTDPGGDREPRDFLILTATKHHLDLYARELESRGVPVQVAGAGVGVDEELGELALLVRGLADPGDQVLTAAALVGAFFGLDHETLLKHREEGGTFSLLHASVDQPEGLVTEALRTLNRWWRWSREQPADVLVERIVEEVGLLPWAASGPLGEVRAGALAYVLESVRRAAMEGRTTVQDALDTILEALDAPEAEAPLRPGREDVVRVMNLHKAKGLEAPVVVLACPAGSGYRHPVTRHIERGGEGGGVGHLAVQERFGWTSLVHARGLEWPRWEEEETRYGDAEEIRKLYVAATRAADELVVARHPSEPDASPWALFEAWLEDRGTELEIVAEPPTPVDEVRATPTELEERVRSLDRDRAGRSRASYSIRSVTARAKTSAEDPGPQLSLELSPPPADGPAVRSRGIPWGVAVHGALAAAGRGLDPPGLRKVCRSLLVENHRPLDSTGEPRELDELVELVDAIRGSELWTRAEAAERILVEAPFAVRMSPETPGRMEVLEGIVDLAFLEADGWVIVDYKTDVGTDPAFQERRRGYRRQVELYGRAWEALTGGEVKERVVFYTARPGEAEHW